MQEKYVFLWIFFS